MKYINRRNLEGELFIFQRSDVTDRRRWNCSYKLKGYKRIFKPLGVVTEEQATKLARQELMQAEQTLEQYGDAALLGKNTVNDALKWFRENGAAYLSKVRYTLILRHWELQLKTFFGGKTPIDRKLQTRMAQYVEWRRRTVNKRTGKRLHAAASTIELEIVSAKQLLKMAREHAGIGKDVGNLTLKLPKDKLQKGKSRSTTFTDAEVQEIQAFFDEDAGELKEKLSSTNVRATNRNIFYLERLRFFVALAFTTGARVNELRQVRVGDFQDDFQSLKIRKSKTRKGSNRDAFIDNEVWDIKKAFSRYMKFFENPTQSGLVFVDKPLGQTGKESTLVGIGATFRSFLKRHKIYYEKKHGKRSRDFLAARHYWITRQVNKGMEAYLVAQSAGTSVGQIEKTYYETDSTQLVKKFKEKSEKTKRAHLKVVK